MEPPRQPPEPSPDSATSPAGQSPAVLAAHAIGAVAVGAACLALQLDAYASSWLTASKPLHCIVYAFGDCESILASGYASFVSGQSINFEAMMARLVPTLMWIALGWLCVVPIVEELKPRYLVAAVVLAVLVSAMALRRRPEPTRVGALDVIAHARSAPREQRRHRDRFARP